MKCANKQYVRYMQQKYGLRVSIRSGSTRSFLYVGTKDNQHLYREEIIGPPEKVWESLWIGARLAVEKYTGEQLFGMGEELWRIKQANRLRSKLRERGITIDQSDNDMVLTPEQIAKLAELAKQPFPKDAPVIQWEDIKKATTNQKQ